MALFLPTHAQCMHGISSNLACMQAWHACNVATAAAAAARRASSLETQYFVHSTEQSYTSPICIGAGDRDMRN